MAVNFNLVANQPSTGFLVVAVVFIVVVSIWLVLFNVCFGCWFYLTSPKTHYKYSKYELKKNQQTMFVMQGVRR